MSLQAELKAKQLGMNFASEKHADILSKFRAIAMELGYRMKTVTIDDVRTEVERLGIAYEPGNWMGSVFKGEYWEWTGAFVAGSHYQSHGRMIRVWRRV